VAPLAPFHPVLQTHAVIAVLPTGERELGGQRSHAMFPVTDLYEPAKHCTHGPPFGPLDPALQIQAAIVVLPARGVKEFGGHTLQAPLDKYELAGHTQGILPEMCHRALHPVPTIAAFVTNLTCKKR